MVPRASQRPRESWVITYWSCCTVSSESQRIKTQKDCTGKGCWRHPAGSQPLPGWARGPLSVPLGPGTPAYKHQVNITAPASRLGAAPGLARVPAALTPASRLGAALGPPRAPMALAPASRLGAAPGPPRAPAALAPVSRPGAAPGPPCVTWAPAPTIWLVAPPKLSRDLRTCSASRKEINKYPLATQAS
jgi:hypothetical protein